ncbi:MAG: segregation/condensation protein A [Verrucomicrobia bacterium]|nr:segregation/condensation protein A [Verrucomicrobiota bacterium]
MERNRLHAPWQVLQPRPLTSTRRRREHHTYRVCAPAAGEVNRITIPALPPCHSRFPALSRSVEDTDYKVRLEIFEGPLDLLLYLIKKEEIDIYNVSLERITRQYLDYIDTFKALNIELASEFIVMAANLMYIKSRELLPQAVQPPEEDAEENDPRWELIRQLMEYKKFKEVAHFLGAQEVKGDELFVTTPELPDLDAPVETIGQVGIFDLIRAFQRILKRFENASDFREIVNDRYTVADKIEELLQTVAVGTKVKFEDLFTSAASRGEVIVTFLAMLELIKLNHLQVEQEQLLGEIVVVRPAV